MVFFSSQESIKGGKTAMEALAAGAVEIISKPGPAYTVGEGEKIQQEATTCLIGMIVYRPSLSGNTLKRIACF